MKSERRRRPERDPAWERRPVSEALRRQTAELAQGFRKVPTRGEVLLWSAIRGKQLDGVKFRRQQPIGPFVVDFYSAEYRLVVEVDGAVHETQRDADRDRQSLLESLGLRVVRFRTETVEKDLPTALEVLRTALREANPSRGTDVSPSPSMGEGAGGWG